MERQAMVDERELIRDSLITLQLRAIKTSDFEERLAKIEQYIKTAEAQKGRDGKSGYRA